MRGNPVVSGLSPYYVIGKIVGRYRIESVLGRGGMGVVFRALDLERGTAVALKSLPRPDVAATLRLKQEFRALADLSHPNLAAVYELFVADEAWFITEELIDGVDFLTYVQGGGAAAPAPISFNGDTADTIESNATSLSTDSKISAATVGVTDATQFRRLRDASRQLAEGLHALHSAGILHCDIKPSNVMVERGGRVAILDFGLAVAIADLAGRGADLSGTVGFMSPEQAARQVLTPAADWYAFGVMVFQSLTGRLPFEGRSRDVLRQKQDAPAPLTASLAPEAPAELCAFCDRLLQRDPRVRPTGEQVVTFFGGLPSPTPFPTGVDEPFLGRAAQLESLHGALLLLRQAQTVVATVSGHSGAGKSYLTQRFLADVRQRRDALVLSGRCYQDESVPYKAIDSVIDTLAHHLLELSDADVRAISPRDVAALTRAFPALLQVPVLQSAGRRHVEVRDQQELRRRGFRALRELLARIGDSRLLVVHIDDLQWGDVDSASVLADLLRPPEPPPLLLLAVFRAEHADRQPCVQALRELPADDRLARVDLDVQPLAPDEAVALALEWLPPDAPDAVARAQQIAADAHGMPFFVVELARQAGHAASSADLDGLVWRRVQELPDSARRLMETVAVCGHPVPRSVAEDASGLETDALGALRILRTQRLLRASGADGAVVEPYHDRIRESVATRLDSATVTNCHHRLALALEHWGESDQETLAVHFEHGGVPVRAAELYATAAGAAADALAFQRAAMLFERALTLGRWPADRRRSLLTSYADALANDGRGAEAARAYVDAADGATAAEQRDLRRRAAYQYCVSGRLQEGRAMLVSVLAPIGVRLRDRRSAVVASLLYRRAKLRIRGLHFKKRAAATLDPRRLEESDLTWAASAGLSMFDILTGAELQARNLYHALSLGEPFRITRALAWEAAHTSNAGLTAWPRTSRLLNAATTLAQEIADPYATAMTTMSSGIAEFTMGRWTTARQRLDSAEELLRSSCTGVAWELNTTQAFSMWARIYQGDLADMTQRTAVLLREARARGDLYASSNLGTFMVPHTLLAQDDPQAAHVAVNEALQSWGIEGYHLQHMTALMARTYIDLYAGEGGTARERLEQRRGWIRAGFFSTIQVLRVFIESLAGRAALMAARENGRWLNQAEHAARTIERERVRWAQPLALLLRAGIANARRQPTTALPLLLSAAAAFDSVPMNGYAAAARWRAADLAPPADAERLRQQASMWMTMQNIRNPERMTRMLVWERTS